MFSRNIEVINRAISDANDIALSTRMEKYSEFMSKFEEIAGSMKEMIIGGINGLKAILMEPIDRTAFLCEIYIDVITTQEFYSMIDSFILQLQKICESFIEEKKITKSGEVIFSINTVPILQFRKVFAPIPRFIFNGIFSKDTNIQTLGPELYLISIYSMYSSPQYAAFLQNEQKLRKYLLKSAKYTGGNTVLVERVSKKIKKMAIDTIIKKLNSKCVVVGQRAIDNSATKLQLITSDSLENVAKQIIECLTEKLNFNEKDIIWSVSRIKFPLDPRYKRLTLRYMGEVLVNVYNNGQFEIIPILDSSLVKSLFGTSCFGISIGNPFILMKFYLIEIWILYQIHKKTELEQDYYKHTIRNLLKSYEFIGNIVDSLHKDLFDAAIFNMSKTYGIYENLVMYIKRSNI